MISLAQLDAGISSFFSTIIIDHTILFVGTVIIFLLLTAFPEIFRTGDFSKLKKFLY